MCLEKRRAPTAPAHESERDVQPDLGALREILVTGLVQLHSAQAVAHIDPRLVEHLVFQSRRRIQQGLALAKSEHFGRIARCQRQTSPIQFLGRDIQFAGKCQRAHVLVRFIERSPVQGGAQGPFHADGVAARIATHFKPQMNQVAFIAIVQGAHIRPQHPARRRRYITLVGQTKGIVTHGQIDGMGQGGKWHAHCEHRGKGNGTHAAISWGLEADNE